MGTALAPTVRTDELDADMVEVVAALANAYHQHVDQTRPDLTIAQIVTADHDAQRIARYLGRQYSGHKLDRLDEWRWTLDIARIAGLG